MVLDAQWLRRQAPPRQPPSRASADGAWYVDLLGWTPIPGLREAAQADARNALLTYDMQISQLRHGLQVEPAPTWNGSATATGLWDGGATLTSGEAIDSGRGTAHRIYDWSAGFVTFGFYKPEPLSPAEAKNRAWWEANAGAYYQGYHTVGDKAAVAMDVAAITKSLYDLPQTLQGLGGVFRTTTEVVPNGAGALALAPELATDAEAVKNATMAARQLGQQLPAAGSGVESLQRDAQLLKRFQGGDNPPGSPIHERFPGNGPQGGPPSGNTPQARPGWNEPWTPPKSWNGPVNHGEWTGPKGNSRWIDDRPEVIRVVGRNPATGEANPIDFYKGQADFSKWKQGEFTVPGLKGDHNFDQPLMRQQFARQKGWFKKDGVTPDENRVRDFLRDANDGFGGKGLRLHHAGGDKVQLIPKDLHKVQHTDMTHPFGG
jgi:hypothetical protein